LTLHIAEVGRLNIEDKRFDAPQGLEFLEGLVTIDPALFQFLLYGKSLPIELDVKHGQKSFSKTI
jgi:hypothetical protein